MKNKLIASTIIVSSALAHITPCFAILMIATGGETTRALGTVALFVSCLSMGYMHGLNRTHELF